MIWPFNRELPDVTCPKCEMRVISSCDPFNTWGGCPVPDAYADRRLQPAATPAAVQEQAAPSDEEIEALAKKHVATGADQLRAICPDMPPYQQTEQFRRVKAMIEEVLARHGGQPALTEQDRQDIETGRKWRENSSLEEWFPLTAEVLVSTKRMFQAAVSDLAAISERLGIDPNEGGAVPIIEAIEELRRERDEWADAGYAAQASGQAQEAEDAARYRWLTEDHDDAGVREHRNSILRRMPVMSYSAACADIDAARAAMKGEGNRE